MAKNAGKRNISDDSLPAQFSPLPLASPASMDNSTENEKIVDLDTENHLPSLLVPRKTELLNVISV